MKRGDIVLAAFAGDTGKPRPALLIQNDLLPEDFDSVILIPITSVIRSHPLLRVTLEPSALNGLRVISQLMLDRMTSFPRAKCRDVIGRVEPATLDRVQHGLAVLLGMV